MIDPYKQKLRIYAFIQNQEDGKLVYFGRETVAGLVELTTGVDEDRPRYSPSARVTRESLSTCLRTAGGEMVPVPDELMAYFNRVGEEIRTPNLDWPTEAGVVVDYKVTMPDGTKGTGRAITSGSPEGFTFDQVGSITDVAQDRIIVKGDHVRITHIYGKLEDATWSE